MYDPFVVAKNHRAKNLLHDLHSLGLREALLLNDFIEEFSSGAEFRDDVEVVAVLKILVHVQNVRVVEFA